MTDVLYCALATVIQNDNDIDIHEYMYKTPIANIFGAY